MPETIAIDALNPVYQQFALASATWFATLFDYAGETHFKCWEIRGVASGRQCSTPPVCV
jgi:hypothetical protein